MALVTGSSVWLLTNGDESDAEDGYRDYLQIEYGSADIYAIPQEGEQVTVRYHDEAYGDVTDIDERNYIVAEAAGIDSGIGAEAADAGDATDSPNVGYLELGDEYGQLMYGNEVFHVANVIGEVAENPDYIPEPSGDDTTPKPEPKPEPNPGPAIEGGQDTPNPAPSKPQPKPSRTSVPNTGDPLAALDGALTATTVAGAALIAHSAHSRAGAPAKSEGE